MNISNHHIFIKYISIYNNNNQQGSSSVITTMQEVPKEFICPISQELFINPVIADDGHTYEESAIKRWFSGGKLKSPLTNEYLKSDKLIPNKTLANLVNSYRYKIGKELIDKCRDISVDEMNVYIENGADINIKNTNGDSLLMVMIRNNRVDLVRKFLKNDPDVLCKNDLGDTAVTIARNVNPSSGIADKLIDIAARQKNQSTKTKKERENERQQFREQQETRRRQQGENNNSNTGGGFQFGFFPLPFFGFSWSNVNNGIHHQQRRRYEAPAPMRPSPYELDARNQVFFSRIFLAIGLVFLLMLIFMPLPASLRSVSKY